MPCAIANEEFFTVCVCVCGTHQLHPSIAVALTEGPYTAASVVGTTERIVLISVEPAHKVTTTLHPSSVDHIVVPAIREDSHWVHYYSAYKFVYTLFLQITVCGGMHMYMYACYASV